MGREIRRVPPNWEHPKTKQWNYTKHREEESYRPLYDEDYDTAALHWIEGFMAWKPGNPDFDNHGAENPYYWDWHGTPPDSKYYRPKWTAEEATHYQMYETVSEGTPVTPAFATKEELVEYLVACGDFWDQHRGLRGWERKHAEAFVKNGYAPSMIVSYTEEGAVIKAPRDGE